MKNEIKFKKSRIFFGLIFCFALLTVSISFLLKPDIYIRNVFMSVEFIRLIGAIGIIYFLALLFSFAKLSSRKYAVRIEAEFIIDHSKYESFGKIKWSDISKIQRFKKSTIEIFMNTDALKSKNSNLLKRFLTFMHHWNYKKSILISSALLDCSIEELFETISEAYENDKLKQY